MAAGKVYDLELVGVPAMRPKRWKGPMVFGIGLALGAGLAAALGALEAVDADALRQEQRAAERSRTTLRDQLAQSGRRITSLTDQLEALRAEASVLRQTVVKQQTALALANQAIEAAERERVLWQDRVGWPAASGDLSGERSPPPSSARRHVNGGFEETPRIDRIFIPRNASTTLRDIARAYGVTESALRSVNPGLVVKRTPDGDFVPEGMRVNIPFRR